MHHSAAGRMNILLARLLVGGYDRPAMRNDDANAV
jgi:hypothetical protein